MCYGETSKEEKKAIEAWIFDLESEYEIKVNRELLYKIFPLCRRANLGFGYVVYMISENLVSKKECVIMSFSLKKGDRSLKNIKKLISVVEKDAREHGCESVSIGSDFGNTERSNKLFRLLGYTKVRSLKKEI